MATTKLQTMVEELTSTEAQAPPREGHVTLAGDLHVALKEFCKERGLKMRAVVEWLVLDLLREDANGGEGTS